jgi:hypothetical protein
MPYTPDVYGRIVSFDMVERAVSAQLEAWLPWYLSELERQMAEDDPDSVPAGGFNRDVTFCEAATFNRMTEDILPAIVVICPGLASRPVRDADGVHQCRFAVAIGVIASAYDHDTTDAAAKAYGACVRAIMGQQPKLGSLNADGVDWVDETYDELPFDDSRSQVAGRLTFTVDVDDVLTTRFKGPVVLPTVIDPLADPDDIPDVDPTVSADGVTINITTMEE